MSGVAAALAAQLGAETRMRLRSGATAFAVLAMFAIAFTYIPDPASNRVSISWERDGVLLSGLYSSAYIGWVVAMLTTMMLPFVGFYLVTGSVKRDLDRHIWPIVAATPTPRVAYLAGKMLSSFAYLMILGAVSLIPATFLFFRYGHGTLEPLELVKPWILLVPPSLLFTAAMALLFDVTPGLRGRGGLVLWFFAWIILFFMIPGNLAGLLDRQKTDLENPAFDPAGLVLVEKSVQQSIGARPKSLNLGINIVSQPIRRIPFPGIPLTSGLVATRAAQLGWSVVALGVASLTFPLGTARSARMSRRSRRKNEAGAAETTEARSGVAPIALVTRPAKPSFSAAAIADAMLIWKSASWIKWPMAAAALIAAVLPVAQTSGPVAVTLILAAIVTSEAAAREELAGAGPLVFAQPGTPRSVVVWKCASVGLFVALLFLPAMLRTAVSRPDRLISLALGLVFVVSASVGLGRLTKGGRFFSALFTAAWYVAVQGALDFTGLFAKVAGTGVPAAFAGAGLLTVATAWLIERRDAR